MPFDTSADIRVIKNVRELKNKQPENQRAQSSYKSQHDIEKHIINLGQVNQAAAGGERCVISLIKLAKGGDADICIANSTSSLDTPLLQIWWIQFEHLCYPFQ